ncbi:hypothetical protein [Mesonia maritima]|uniref:Uncharacterized protein n=1 Tax=Mesonia maritima TaxID=1793873 RepID=A0ABU1K7R4_9FLAO|nr:hypothetical protein [Mesonia maritima]MDR6301655.1 hypothetical protein [Mesonia maritima]
MRYLFFLFTLLFTTTLCSQNRRDILIHDSIQPILYNFNKYKEVKRLVLSLEKEFGKEPSFRYKLLNQSYVNNDIPFFKSNLTDLVKNYGVNINYFSENEHYFHAITKGELSIWFKKMYLKNHFIWMKNNFDKQRDLKKINEIYTKDQLVNGQYAKIDQHLSLDSLQKSKLDKLLGDFFLSNVENLKILSEKIDTYPTAKNFAIVQNGLATAELHLLQSSNEILTEYWNTFFNYYKKAYLKNEMDYMIFKNYDLFHYVKNGTQVFGLLEPSPELENFLDKKIDSIPIEDENYKKRIQEELGWNNHKMQQD